MTVARPRSTKTNTCPLSSHADTCKVATCVLKLPHGIEKRPYAHERRGTTSTPHNVWLDNNYTGKEGERVRVRPQMGAQRAVHCTSQETGQRNTGKGFEENRFWTVNKGTVSVSQTQPAPLFGSCYSLTVSIIACCHMTRQGHGRRLERVCTFMSKQAARTLHKHFCFLCNQTFTSTWQRKLEFCPECRNAPLYDVAKLLLSQLKRAQKAHLLATLTLDRWLYTISFFDGLCAYCQKTPYKCMDHFVPLELGGGTTWDNMVPACHGCNHRKGSKPPEQVLKADELERVRVFLYTRNDVGVE
jgi:5-methylcytosine-specific restriction endonuclease McrA